MLAAMHRLGFALVLAVATLACEKSQTPPPVEPEPAAEPAPPTAVDEPEPEPESTPEPAPTAEPEVSQFDATEFSEAGFEARDVHCTFEEPSSKATGYIKASLVDADAALEACLSKGGAAIRVEWKYIGGPTSDISVDAENQKVANCVANVVAKNISAGVKASCSAVFLLGDTTAAAAAYEARK
jgi:hypothetical protein